MLTESVEKPNHRSLCNKYTQVEWKSLPKNVRKLWAFLAVNQSFPSSLNEWTVKQIAQFVEKNLIVNYVYISYCVIHFIFYLGTNFGYQILVMMNFIVYCLMNSLKWNYMTLTLIIPKYKIIKHNIIYKYRTVGVKYFNINFYVKDM